MRSWFRCDRRLYTCHSLTQRIWRWRTNPFSFLFFDECSSSLLYLFLTLQPFNLFDFLFHLSSQHGVDTQDLCLLGGLDGVLRLFFLPLLLFLFPPLLLLLGGSFVQQLLSDDWVHVLEVINDWRIFSLLFLPRFLLCAPPGVLFRDLFLHMLCDQRVDVGLSLET